MNTLSKIKTWTASLLIAAAMPTAVKAQAYTENFDNITTLTGSGWFQQNNSSPVGTNPVWFQGTPPSASGPFIAYNGADNAYIACNFNSTAGGTGTISNWLVTPNRILRNGDVFTFYTRKPTIGAGQTDYPDRIEVRLSTNGASTNVGTTATGVGDFTTLLLSVNPTLVAGVYPQVWTQYTITISGLPAPTSGRIAFRYFVTNAGPTGANSDYIGIDNVVYTPYVCPAFTMTTGGALSGATAGTAYSNTLSQTGALGAPNFAVTAGALPPGLTLSAAGTISGTPTATGTFNFTVTVSDASGCSGSQSYSITVVCPANPITNASLPTFCSNAADHTLAEFSPAGGTYSGTGVTAGVFDPSVGTQLIQYDYTDAYGCAHNSSGTYTVNTAPTVNLGTQSTLCSNDALYAITGASPGGGTFTGTGVSGSDFDPSVGTQTVTYTYTDGNNCSNSASQTITVNTAPTVTHAPISDICENAGLTALTGASPAGGTYSGTGVSGTDFDPSVGSQTLTYAYTDGNGCSNSTSVSITVIPAETATLAAFTAVCSNEGIVTLSGGLPAGGTYSGTGVTGTDFDPSVGTETITYTVGGGTACESSASQVFTVNTAPTVALSLATTSTCVNYNAFTLSGGTPAGGTYSGTGVNAGSFDPAVAGIGTTSITYDFTDGNGCSNSASATVTVDACASLEEDGFTMTISPNPTSGKVLIAPSVQLNASDLKCTSGNGQLLDLSWNELSNGTWEIDLSNFADGIYYLQVTLQDKTQVYKLVKQ